MFDFMKRLFLFLLTPLLLIFTVLGAAFTYNWAKVLAVSDLSTATLVKVAPALAFAIVTVLLARELFRRLQPGMPCIHQLAIMVGDYLEHLAEMEGDEDDDALFPGWETMIVRAPVGDGYRVEATDTSGDGAVHVTDFFGPDAFSRAETYALMFYGSYGCDVDVMPDDASLKQAFAA